MSEVVEHRGRVGRGSAQLAGEGRAGCKDAAVKFGVKGAPACSLVKLLNPAGCLVSEVDMVTVKPCPSEA